MQHEKYFTKFGGQRIVAKEYRLMPNEAVILKEVSVAHGGVRAVYTDELMLTNLNIVCTNKGMLGNTKNILQYPLSQIKKYNGRPQVIMGKLSNGMPCLEVYFINGGKESFKFQSGNKKKINQWIKAIGELVGGESVDQSTDIDTNDYDGEDTLVGAFKEVGEQFKDVGTEILGSLGFRLGKKMSAPNQGVERISKKCVSCSAPLVGNKGQTVKCKYCDTEQSL
ncbi:hypothetical protein [Pauljensenia sp. UMB0895]|uniref:hypothetical protein n=1 Tax=Pauljensenia sp. UMB0895 TaxID=3046319 RepID=UPI00254AC44C|nr:hypothetical protein [Pauljensenia sp. UMB0895]MDK7337204.1 hypothetical protein [Pauljensenia sp. UMB0895]